MKKYLNEGHLGLFFGLTAFVYFLFTGLTREKITSDNDLVEIRGKYLRHSFKDNTGFKNFTHQYYIWIENYSKAFQVKAGYLGIFNTQEFLRNVSQGDDLTFSIPKRLIEKLNSADNVFLTSIEGGGRTYLDKNKVLEIEKDLATSNSDYFFGMGFLIAGLIVYLRLRLAKTKS